MTDITKINSLLIPYNESENQRLAQPNSIKINISEEGYPENYVELKEVKNNEGEVLWGKYDWLIEDDYGNATKFSEVDAEAKKGSNWSESYSKWAKLFENQLEYLELASYWGLLASNNRIFALDRVRPTDIKSLFEGDSTEWTLGMETSESETYYYPNFYYTDILGANFKVKEGFYIDDNKDATSWGSTTPYAPGVPKSFRGSRTHKADYVLSPASLLNDLTVYPKYGTVKVGIPYGELDFTKLKFKYKDPITSGSYTYLNNSETNISIDGQIFKFGSELDITYHYIEDIQKKDWLVPQDKTTYNYKLNRTEYDIVSDTEHYLAAPNKFIKLPIEVTYPLYLKNKPSWTTKTETSSSTSGDQGTVTSKTCYQLNNANLSLNPLVIDTLVEKPIKVTLRSDYKGFCAGTATDITTPEGRQNIIDTYTDFYSNLGSLIAPTTPKSTMIEGSSIATVSFELNPDETTNNIYTNYPDLSTNSWDKKEGYLQVAFPSKYTYKVWQWKTQTTESSVDDPYALSPLGLEGGTTTPDPDIDLPGTGGGLITPDVPVIKICEEVDTTYYHTTKPNICYLTYSWDNKLYYINYLESSPTVKPLQGIITASGGLSSVKATYSSANGLTKLYSTNYLPSAIFEIQALGTNSDNSISFNSISLPHQIETIEWLLGVDYYNSQDKKIQTIEPISLETRNDISLKDPCTFKWTSNETYVAGPSTPNVASKVCYKYIVKTKIDGVDIEAIWVSELIDLI